MKTKINISTNFLKTIDVFGVPVSMNFFGKPKSQSIAGGAFSILLVAFYGWAIYIATEELFSRTNPNTNYSELYRDDPPEMVLSEKNFPIGFQVQDPSDKAYIDDTIYKLTMLHTYMETIIENGTITLKETTTEIQTERCRQEHFGELAPRSTLSLIKPTHCMVLNQTNLDKMRRIQGVYGSPVFQRMHIQISECDNATSPVPCASREKIHSSMSGAWFGFIYPNMVVNLENLTNPDSKYPEASFFVIDSSMIKSMRIALGYIDVVTDDGWISKNYETQKFVKVNNIQETSYPQTTDNKILVNCYIEADKLGYYYSRNYKKIQDALATIGGIMNTAFIVLILITTPYFRYKYKETLMHELYDVFESDCETIKYHDIKSGKSQKLQNFTKKFKTSGPKLEQATDVPPNKTLSKSQTTEIREFKKVENRINSSLSKSPKKCLNYSLPETSQPLNIPMKSPTMDNLERNSLKNIDYEKPCKENFKLSKSPISTSPRMYSKRKSTKKDSPPNLENSAVVDVKISNKPEEPDDKIINLNDLEIFSKEEQQTKKKNNSSEVNQEQQSSSREHKKKGESHPPNVLVEPNNSSKANQNLNPGNTVALEDGLKIDLNDDYDDYYDDENEENVENKEPETQETKAKLTLWEFFCSFIYRTNALKAKMELIDKGITKVDKQIDIVYIVKKLQELDKLKLLLLGRERSLLFHYLPKIDVMTPKKRKPGERLPFSHLLKKLSYDQHAPKKGLADKVYKKLNKKENKTTLDQWILRAFKEK